VVLLQLIFCPTQPCNPAVGGPATSQLVHEVDALGGEIGKITDRYEFKRLVVWRMSFSECKWLRVQILIAS
jgi:tRNA uridine 5-carboxymethylaminomethyl modification enzyme